MIFANLLQALGVGPVIGKAHLQLLFALGRLRLLEALKFTHIGFRSLLIAAAQLLVALDIVLRQLVIGLLLAQGFHQLIELFTVFFSLLLLLLIGRLVLGLLIADKVFAPGSAIGQRRLHAADIKGFVETNFADFAHARVASCSDDLCFQCSLGLLAQAGRYSNSTKGTGCCDTPRRTGSVRSKRNRDRWALHPHQRLSAQAGASRCVNGDNVFQRFPPNCTPVAWRHFPVSSGA
jgi:hypothetical protein